MKKDIMKHKKILPHQNVAFKKFDIVKETQPIRFLFIFVIPHLASPKGGRNQDCSP
ncbi:MAG: hypothetical protein ACJARD_001057 [Alphaproteobacteria bacterium]|jgi:hypothetical protein